MAEYGTPKGMYGSLLSTSVMGEAAGKPKKYPSTEAGTPYEFVMSKFLGG